MSNEQVEASPGDAEAQSAAKVDTAGDADPLMPLFVDLDDSLVATDCLYESLLLSVKDPLDGGSLWYRGVLAGPARLKQLLAEKYAPDAALLPYHPKVLDLIREEASRGRPVILTTAADRKIADAVAEHLGVFRDVLASDGEVNLKGSNKLDRIRSYCREHGYERFAYLGDSASDVVIFREAGQSYLVGPDSRTRHEVAQAGGWHEVLPAHRQTLRGILRIIRPHQWAKNVLLFVPMLLAHEWSNLGSWLAALGGFVAFSLTASSVYVLNDLVDIESDRRHPSKRERPFASGRLHVRHGPALTLGLLAGGFAVAAGLLPWAFLGVLLVYLALTMLYSFWLKRKMVVDVLTLAGLYTLRLLAGAVAVGVPASPWLLAFSIFLFTSLAFAKRYTELSQAGEGTKLSGRGYTVSDLSMVEVLGPCAGYQAVMVLALYINSDKVKLLYENPGPLWLLCPLLLFWVSRLWMLARRGELHEDPVLFTLRDRNSQLVGLLAAGLVAVAAVWRG